MEWNWKFWISKFSLIWLTAYQMSIHIRLWVLVRTASLRRFQDTVAAITNFTWTKNWVYVLNLIYAAQKLFHQVLAQSILKTYIWDWLEPPRWGDVVWRISRWPPWRPSWISEQNEFSNSESLCCSDASHQVSAPFDLRFGKRCRLKNFKMAAILDIRTKRF